MKAKAAKKAAPHAKPARKHARVKVPSRPPASPPKKETPEPVAAEPQVVETVIATYEEPVGFVVTEPEPAVDIIEIYEIAEAGGGV